MRCEGWRSSRIVDMVSFSPRETLPKNKLAKKVAMEKLSPFQKAIDGFELNNFNGGTKFRNGDTLLARITPCLENGKTAKVSILEEGEVGFGSSEYIVMRNKPGITDADFVYYLATSPAFRELAIKSMVGTSGRQRVQQDLIESAVMSFPPLPEQRAIAATLSCLDDKIELNNRMNKTLEEIAQAIFKSWFVDFEPFLDGEFVDSELGRIPKGWRVGILADLLDVKYGKDHKKLPDGEIPVYGSGGLMRCANNAIFTGESVLIPRKGTLSNVMYVNESFWTVDTMFYTVMKYKASAKYVYQLLLMKDLAGMNAGSAVPSMTTDILNNLPVLIPCQSILDQFDSILTPLYVCIASNMLHSAQLAQIRDLLLPRLMSGEIRVP